LLGLELAHARLFVHHGDYENAGRHAQRAMSLAEGAGDSPALQEAEDLLATASGQLRTND
jgi:hypothetical protein